MKMVQFLYPQLSFSHIKSFEPTTDNWQLATGNWQLATGN
jgi:hypothetical protein